MKRKGNHFLARTLLLLLAAAPLSAVTATADDAGKWHRTIIVATLDGTTMEYLLDRGTRVTIDKPNLVIETEGVVLTYDLSTMGQVRYGKRFIPDAIDAARTDASAFTMDGEKLYFNKLKANTLIEIYGADGTTVFSRRLTGQAEVALSSLPTGVYLLKVDRETYKILKK